MFNAIKIRHTTSVNVRSTHIHKKTTIIFLIDILITITIKRGTPLDIFYFKQSCVNHKYVFGLFALFKKYRVVYYIMSLGKWNYLCLTAVIKRTLTMQCFYLKSIITLKWKISSGLPRLIVIVIVTNKNKVKKIINNIYISVT